MSSMLAVGQRLTRRAKIIALISVGVFIAAAIYCSQNRHGRDDVLIPCGGGWQHDAGSTEPPTAPVTPQWNVQRNAQWNAVDGVVIEPPIASTLLGPERAAS